MSEEIPKKKLTEKQELFCQFYVSEETYGNGTRSYMKAYKLDATKRGAEKTARSNAHKLLTNTDICARINELLDVAGLNDAFVDKQLLLVITQHADLNAKNNAIKEYNKLKGRITDLKKIEHTGINITVGENPDPAYLKWKQEQIKNELTS